MKTQMSVRSGSPRYVLIRIPLSFRKQITSGPKTGAHCARRGTGKVLFCTSHLREIMTWKINSLPLFTNLPSVIAFVCNWIQKLITNFCLKGLFVGSHINFSWCRQGCWSRNVAKQCGTLLKCMCTTGLIISTVGSWQTRGKIRCAPDFSLSSVCQNVGVKGTNLCKVITQW